jgi:hypothetical protein
MVHASTSDGDNLAVVQNSHAAFDSFSLQTSSNPCYTGEQNASSHVESVLAVTLT